jgi:hypothetical protein
MRLVRNDLNIHELRLLGLRRLQYFFFILALVCIIVLIWYPGNWLQIVITAALLLVAGALCKSGRER